MLFTILSVLLGAIAGIAFLSSVFWAAALVLYSCNENPDPKEEQGFAKSAFFSYGVVLIAFGLLSLLILARGGA